VTEAAPRELSSLTRQICRRQGRNAARAFVPDASDMSSPRQERFRVAAAAVWPAAMRIWEQPTDVFCLCGVTVDSVEEVGVGTGAKPAAQSPQLGSHGQRQNGLRSYSMNFVLILTSRIFFCKFIRRRVPSIRHPFQMLACDESSA
jgi:hypothetical protein